MNPPIRSASTSRRINRFITIGLICAFLTALILPSSKWIAQAMRMSCDYAGTDNEGTYYWTCVQYDDSSDGWPYYGGGGGADSKQDKINRAVADARAILQRGGRCASFFQDGYSDINGVLNALDSLGGQLTPSTLSSSENDVGIKQWGTTSTIMYAPNGTNYRLFEHAVVNNNGPFFSAFYPGTSTVRPRIGSTSAYNAGSRKAQALMILHELAHLIQMAGGGGYLIPGDGDDANQSRTNTNTIDAQCHDDIEAVVP